MRMRTLHNSRQAMSESKGITHQRIDIKEGEVLFQDKIYDKNDNYLRDATVIEFRPEDNKKGSESGDYFDNVLADLDREDAIKEIGSLDNLFVINGAQDFKRNRAFVGVGIPDLSITNGYSIRNFLITSEGKKISMNKDDLLKQKIIVERFPNLIERWGSKDIEDFVKNPTKTSLQDIFTEIRNKSRFYLEFSNEGMHSFITLWIIGTYFHRLFVSYPYVHLNGNAGSGKTKCLSLIAALGFNGELSVNNTPSYMIRVVHCNHATSCIDEVEKFNRPKDEETKTILAMLNAGYKRGSMVGKSEQGGKGNKWKPVRFEAYSPKVLAGISSLPPTLVSRCIPLIMIKSGNKDLLNREINEYSNEWQIIRDKLYRAMLGNFSTVSSCYEDIKEDEIAGRSWELWKPIFSIAKSISEETYAEIRAIALEVERKKKDLESEASTTPILLKGLLELILAYPDKIFYPTQDILDFLRDYDEEFKWLGDDKVRANKGRWLGNELRKAGVMEGKMEQKKVNDENKKGCSLSEPLIISLLKRFGVEPEKMEQGENQISSQKSEEPVGSPLF